MKKETKKLIAAGIVMALSCGAWGSVSAQAGVTANGTTENINGKNVELEKTLSVDSQTYTSMYVKNNGKIEVTSDKLSFKGVSKGASESKPAEMVGSHFKGEYYFAGWLDGNGTIDINTKELYVGSKEVGADRGFQMKNFVTSRK